MIETLLKSYNIELIMNNKAIIKKCKIAKYKKHAEARAQLQSRPRAETSLPRTACRERDSQDVGALRAGQPHCNGQNNEHEYEYFRISGCFFLEARLRALA